jgi:hypothetical protein
MQISRDCVRSPRSHCCFNIKKTPVSEVASIDIRSEEEKRSIEKLNYSATEKEPEKVWWM